MEDNELHFCSIWAEEKINLDFRVDLLANKNFKGDYFFNRLNYLSENVDESIIDRSIEFFSKKGLDCYVCLMHENRALENLLLSKGFYLLDTMYVLGRKKLEKESVKSKHGAGHHKYVQVNLESLSIWISVFCESFEILELKKEVEQIIRPNFDKLSLLLSIVDGTPAGCAALYNKNNLSGIYCLGTILSMRNKGVAKGMLDHIFLTLDGKGFDFPFLQTLRNDNFLGFYKELGFELLYTKKIYSLKLGTQD